MLFERAQIIGEYTILFPIKTGSYAETYRVKGKDGKVYFLKIYNYAKLHRTQFDDEGNVVELVIAKQLDHPNLASFHDCGEQTINGQKYAYIVFDFISGETVAERIGRQQGCSVDEAKSIITGVLEGVKYLHNLPNPVMHNELTIQNVMLDLSQKKPQPKIIDFGYARFLSQNQSSFMKQGLNLFYLAPEAMNGIFTAQSDVFSVGAMLYHLLYGLPPYFVDFSRHKGQSEEDLISNEREHPLRILALDGDKAEQQLVNVLARALAVDVEQRFTSADEFQKALNGEIEVTAPVLPKRIDTKPTNTRSAVREDMAVETLLSKKCGNGFKDVAGMTDLKSQLQSDVIDVLREPERAKKFGLSLPNGLLFYGPPGCGKTYFAEKFAEEVGCNYIYVRCSDVASPYIHGGQGKIAALFDDARKQAPAIIFLDEIELMLRDRSKQDNASMAGEVNEFLTHLNNCGKEGIIVIGASNKPTDIDKAAIRSGRLEYKYYIPLPDLETRSELFRIHLKSREVDENLDYDRLAAITDNFSSSDITLIAEKAGREVFRNRQECITMPILEEVISISKPTVSAADLKAYEAIRDEFEGRTVQVERKRIGFK